MNIEVFFPLSGKDYWDILMLEGANWRHSFLFLNMILDEANEKIKKSRKYKRNKKSKLLVNLHLRFLKSKDLDFYPIPEVVKYEILILNSEIIWKDIDEKIFSRINKIDKII